MLSYLLFGLIKIVIELAKHQFHEITAEKMPSIVIRDVLTSAIKLLLVISAQGTYARHLGGHGLHTIQGISHGVIGFIDDAIKGAESIVSEILQAASRRQQHKWLATGHTPQHFFCEMDPGIIKQRFQHYINTALAHMHRIVSGTGRGVNITVNDVAKAVINKELGIVKLHISKMLCAIPVSKRDTTLIQQALPGQQRQKRQSVLACARPSASIDVEIMFKHIGQLLYPVIQLGESVPISCDRSMAPPVSGHGI